MRRAGTGMVLLALLAVAAVAVPGAGASVTLALDLRELVQGSEHVVVATVQRQAARYDARRRIVTDVTLRVEESLKGPRRTGETLVVTRLGGAIGELGMRVEGEPTFEDGARSIVFVRRAAGGTLRPLGMSQGVLPIRRIGGIEQVLPNGAGLALLRRTPQGRLVHAPAAIPVPRALHEVLAQIRELVIESAL